MVTGSRVKSRSPTSKLKKFLPQFWNEECHVTSKAWLLWLDYFPFLRWNVMYRCPGVAPISYGSSAPTKWDQHDRFWSASQMKVFPFIWECVHAQICTVTARLARAYPCTPPAWELILPCSFFAKRKGSVAFPGPFPSALQRLEEDLRILWRYS